MSRRASEGESASTASMREPKMRCAVAAKNAESTPPEYATIRLSNCLSRDSRACSLAAASTKPASPLDIAADPICFACALAVIAGLYRWLDFCDRLGGLLPGPRTAFAFDAPGCRQ